MTHSDVLSLAIRLWPGARDTGQVADPADLDVLLAAQGQPGAPGYEGGVRGTFACFAPDEEATLTLSTGEHAVSDAEARLLGHLLVTRVLMAAGLHIDRRVQRAVGDAYAVTWCVKGGYRASPLALANSIWLVALDPLHRSDRPIPIDWSPEAYQDAALWNLDYRLFSHYDIRERALDWTVYASLDPKRHAGCSIWTIVEPLLRLDDDRSFQALSVFAEASDEESDVPAAAILDRGRIAALLRVFAAQHRERR
ncbi:MAG: hypothetical protein O2798_10285 [Chloroflexi bacterium]|nr:hypothetical protein [Chloroflexota bacterium]MDA1241210.1 hypothetical protein [Chloroflexota bacterium]